MDEGRQFLGHRLPDPHAIDNLHFGTASRLKQCHCFKKCFKNSQELQFGTKIQRNTESEKREREGERANIHSTSEPPNPQFTAELEERMNSEKTESEKRESEKRAREYLIELIQ